MTLLLIFLCDYRIVFKRISFLKKVEEFLFFNGSETHKHNMNKAEY